MSGKILIVDDEHDIVGELQECLQDEGYECITASSGEEGLSQLRTHRDVTVVVTDLRMPGCSGLDMIQSARAELGSACEAEFIVLTGHGDLKDAVVALKYGVMDFLAKPVDLDQLVESVANTDQLVLRKRVERYLQEGLRADVQVKEREIHKLVRSLETAYAEALNCLATASEYKDPETGAHICRIGAYAAYCAKELGWSAERQSMIRIAAPLHDVGKIGIPDSILLKPGALLPDEVAIMKTHAAIGKRILSQSDHPTMKMAANIAGGHHETWNGKGYPSALSGHQIPPEARITTLVDVYDALRSERPYKKGFDHDTTMGIILEGDGRTDPSHFDPELLELFAANAADFAKIFTELADGR